MPAAPLLVLLPGLDGSGDLFTPVCALAASAFEVRVLRYDHAADQSYTRLIVGSMNAVLSAGAVQVELTDHIFGEARIAWFS